MKVLMIADVPGWAIGKLARIYIDGNPQFHWRELYVHPKNVRPEDIDKVRTDAAWADIVIFEYWRTAQQLLDAIPEIKAKKLVLMHHNQKNLNDFDQSCFSMLLCHTAKAKMELTLAGYENVEIIPYGLDFDLWQYNDEYPPKNDDGKDERTVGYAGRTVPWKNIHMIAAACYELNLPLVFMGKMDKQQYWTSIPQEHRDHMDMSYLDCPDEDRPNFYKQLSIFVNASSAGREEGTLPLLEAMASGVPVITTRSGTAADIIIDRENGIIIPFDDQAALKDAIAKLMESPELREKLRKNAWNTIRGYSAMRMARRYADLLHRLYSDQPLVSVIVPAHEIKNLDKLLHRLDEVYYPNIEIVICDDSDGDDVHIMVDQARKNMKMPVKWLTTESFTKRDPDNGGKPYGLAEARNRGIIEAMGEYLLFCDSRILPEPDCIEKFLAALKDKKKTWVFGDKGALKDTFVENFSMIRRQDIIDMGMFNERIDQYGGMSQELRERCRRQKIETLFVPEAEATTMKSSHMSPERRKSILAMKDLLWKINL